MTRYMKMKLSRIAEPTTSETSYVRLSKTLVVESNVSNTEMKTFVRGA